MKNNLDVWEKVYEDYDVQKIELKTSLNQEMLDIFEEHTPKGAQLLECGSGSGAISLFLALHGFKTSLLDQSDNALSVGKSLYAKHNKKGEFIKGDLFKIPLKDKAVDCSWNSGVMEHFSDEEMTEGLKEMARVSRDKVIVIVPNSQALFYRLGKENLEKKGKWPYGEEYPISSLEDQFALAGISMIQEGVIGVKEGLQWLNNTSLGGESIPEMEGMLKEFKDESIKRSVGYLLYAVGSVKKNKAGGSPKRVNTERADRELITLTTKINLLLGKMEARKEKTDYLKKENDNLRVELEKTKSSLDEIKREIDWLQYHLDQIYASKAWRLSRIISFLVHPIKFIKTPDKKNQILQFLALFPRPIGLLLKFLIYYPLEAIYNIYDFFMRLFVQIRLTILISSKAKKARGIIIYPPTVDWSWMKQRPHQLIEGLSKKGYLCLYADIRHREFGGKNQITKINPFLYVLGRFDALPRINQPILLIGWTEHFHILKKFKNPVVIYDYLDDLSVSAEDVDKEKLEHHRYFLENADVVLVTAEKLEKDAKDFRKDILSLPNAANVSDFALKTKPAIPKDLKDIVQKGKTVIGYYGALAKWFDYDLIKKVADKRSDFEFVLIGPDYDHSIKKEHLNRYKNIHWLGIKKYQELPEYLYYFDIATIPFVINDITSSTSPVKIFEYMAGGKPIISTPLQECKKYKSVLLAETADEFEKKVEQAQKLAKDRKYLETLKKEAEENTWEKRIDIIVSELEKISQKND